MWALKQLGVTCIVATTACGSLKEEYKPGNAALLMPVHETLTDFIWDRIMS